MKQRENGCGPRVTVLFGADVVGVESDFDGCLVTLRSGEVHAADAVIGADGPCGVIRRMLMQEEGAVPEHDDVPTGMAAYSAFIPRAVAVKDPDLASFYEFPKCTINIGSNRGAITCSASPQYDIQLWVYTPDGCQDGTHTEVADMKLADILGPCDNQLQKLAALAGPPNCILIKNSYDLESWVSESGRVLAVGEAAHPFPPVSLHTYAIALEDGAFIGKIFSHTRNRDRIPEFLHAFQEHREPRCYHIREQERAYIGVITLPDGEMQEARDVTMRANQAAGRNVMDVPEANLQDMMDEMRMTFGYEPADDADEWWMSWGRFRDIPEAANDTRNGHLSWTFSNQKIHDDES